jgi:hypothetical protein
MKDCGNIQIVSGIWEMFFNNCFDNCGRYIFRKGVKLSDSLPKTYRSKPTVVYKGKSVWPEITFLLEFKSKGYNGVWVDAFHKKYWQNEKDMVKIEDLPKRIQEILGKGTRGCWDLLLWTEEDLKFVEIKGVPSRDKIRKNQTEFRDNLLRKGLEQEDFTVIDWDYQK